MQYFTYSWHNRFTVQVPNLITVVFLLFLKSQFATNAQNIVLLNQWMYGHIWERTVALLCRSRGCCLWFSWHTKGIVEVSLHVHLELNTLGFWNVTTDKSLQDWRWVNAGAVRLKMKWFRTYTDMKFGVGNSLLKFVQACLMVWYCTCCFYTIVVSVVRICSHWIKHLFVAVHNSLHVRTGIFNFIALFPPVCALLFPNVFLNFLSVFYFCSLLCTVS